MDVVFIEGLRVSCVIGVFDWERHIEQDLVIDVEVRTDVTATAGADDISGGINYAELAEEITTHTRAAQRFTVEAVAEDVAALALRRPAALGVRVRVTKPGAVPTAAGVGVVVERSNSASARPGRRTYRRLGIGR